MIPPNTGDRECGMNLASEQPAGAEDCRQATQRMDK